MKRLLNRKMTDRRTEGQTNLSSDRNKKIKKKKQQMNKNEHMYIRTL